MFYKNRLHDGIAMLRRHPEWVVGAAAFVLVAWPDVPVPPHPLGDVYVISPVPAPPPGVNTSLDPVMMGEPPKTVRERMELHRTNPSCASCHAFIDPPGFLFEHFDSSGAYRTVQEGVLPIDSSGELDGKPMVDARDLATVLETDERVGRCMVKQLYRHAQGRLETDGEAVALETLADRFSVASFDFRSLLLELVTHDAFRFVGTKEIP